jgi:hypothetical protein
MKRPSQRSYLLLIWGQTATKTRPSFQVARGANRGFCFVSPHAGSRLVIHGREFRVINDDNVEGTVDDPRGIKRK